MFLSHIYRNTVKNILSQNYRGGSIGCHGQKKSGKKQELVDTVRDCIGMKTKVDLSIDGGKWYNIKKHVGP
jgi:hypothetical protein